MNLIEAIKTGRPFRRTGYTDWYVFIQVGDKAYLHCESPADKRVVNREIYLSDFALFAEYEIQEPSVPITRAQALKAFAETWLCAPEGPAFESFLKRLGL